MKNINKIYIRSDVIYTLFIPLIIIGKLVRFTIMKEVLVDEGIGHGMLEQALNGGSASGEAPGIFMSQIIWFLSLFGFNTYLQFEFFFTVVWNILVLLMLFKMKKYLTIMQAIFITFSIMILNIFSFTLSKEPVQMLFFILVYLILLSEKPSYKAKLIGIAAVMLLASVTFRSYYILIVYFMAVAQFVFIILKNKNMKMITIGAIFLIIAGTSYFAILNLADLVNHSNVDELIRVRATTRGSAATVIAPSIRTDNYFFMSVNYVLVLLRMLFPLELLRLGLKYIPYVLYQLLITWVFFLSFKRYNVNSPAVNLAMIIYFAFLCCSATFEPDFGSWVRHESVVFPVILLMTGIKGVLINGGRDTRDTSPACL